MWRAGLAFVLAVGHCTGQIITATNWTVGGYTASPGSNVVDLTVWIGRVMRPMIGLLPLTMQASSQIPPPGNSGTAIIVNASNQLTVNDHGIALISCDAGAYAGLIDAPSVFLTAERANATSIILYSRFADYCNLTNNVGSYPWIYSMKSIADTQNLLANFNGSAPSQPIIVIALPEMTQQVANSTDPNSATPTSTTSSPSPTSSNQSQNNNPLGSSPSTAVAMIILYSITGVITALFLIVVLTGSIRAHRHPELYGPRNLMGRPRQSRARGLARAMLDSLPIVKFGDREAPKPTEVELAESQNAGREAAPGTESTEAATTLPPSTAETEHQHRADGGIAAATLQDADSPPPSNQGCSICTEDFEIGQDQRVLPCDHRFHPVCIDPWLLNVSGTCPLCRIDLRPQTAQASDAQEFDENGNAIPRSDSAARDGTLPPPLEPQGPQRNSIRRSILLGILGPSAAARPETMSREERVLALRQYRGQAQAAAARRRRALGQRSPDEGPSAVAETAEEDSGLRARLRTVFRIRTRRTGQTAPSDEAAGA